MLATAAVDYATETLSDALWDEITPLLEKHWHEVAHYRDIPLAPDRGRYKAMEETGSLRVYTARIAAPAPDRGRLVGYLAAIVARSLHYSSVTYASQDVLFVDPTHRGSRTGIKLILHAHDALRREGVTALYQHTKARGDLNIGPMLERILGYEKVDEIYAVRLDHDRDC